MSSKRPPTPLPDRDKRRPITPPTGVREQIAPPVPYESWEDKQSLTPVKSPPTKTEVPEMPIETLIRRSGDTKNAAITTLDRVEILRRETREDISKTQSRIDQVDEKVDAVIEVVGDLRVEVTKNTTQGASIIELLEEQREQRKNTEHVVTTATIAKLEVDKSRQLTELELAKARGHTELELAKASGLDTIDAKKERRKHIWALVWKAIAAVGVLWAFVSVTYLSKCGH